MCVWVGGCVRVYGFAYQFSVIFVCIYLLFYASVHGHAHRPQLFVKFRYVQHLHLLRCSEDFEN